MTITEYKLGWLFGDPAEQFHYRYLGVGTTKREELLLWSNLASGELVREAVVYVDPDGEFIFMALALISRSLPTLHILEYQLKNVENIHL